MWYQGRLAETVSLCREQLQIAQQSGFGQTDRAASIASILAYALSDRAELAEARQLIDNSCQLCEKIGFYLALSWCYLCRVKVLFAQGDYSEAMVTLDKLDALALKATVPAWASEQAKVWRVRLALAEGKGEPRWLEVALQDVEESAMRLSGAMTELHTQVTARILMLLGRHQEAAAAMEQFVSACNKSGRRGMEIEGLVLWAEVLWDKGEREVALEKLTSALALAEVEGFVRAFVEEGQVMARMLYEVAADQAYAGQLLNFFSDTPQIDAGQGMVEPLNARETEVLQLLGQGLSNQEIADKLHLTLSTVKWHTSNIYGKLGVKNRTRAVARAKSIGIFPRE